MAADKTDDGKVKCYGANTCKGTGACGGAGHACAGKNGCKGQGFTKADSEEACLKMAGGRLTAEAPRSNQASGSARMLTPEWPRLGFGVGLRAEHYDDG